MPYTIKDMSELTGLPASTLRYYDKKGLLPNLRRDHNNVRIFTDDDYRQLRFIECLKRSGLSIKDIHNFITLTKHGDTALNERLEIFTRRRDILRKELADLQEVLNLIEYKCWYYTKACEAGSEESVKDIMLSDVPAKFREAREYLHKTISPA